jgi:hypothetical protein
MDNKLTIDYSELKLYYQEYYQSGWKIAIPYYDTYIAYKVFGLKALIPGYILYKQAQLIFQPFIERLGTLSDNDTENIKKIIKAGKESGLDELELTINKNKGVDIGADLDSLGIPINAKFQVGSQGKMTIKVKYK